MLGVPTLFERNPKSRTVTNEYIPLNTSSFPQWEAMERMPGADVRVTVRRHEVVRLEVVKKPDEEQRQRGILVPWYRDSVDRGPDHWVHEAARQTDFSTVPDGEWFGEAIGEKIMRNPLGIEGHRILLSSLFPWRDQLPDAPIPPQLGRTPLDYDDLRYWLAHTKSRYVDREGVGLDGVVWWYLDEPIAQIRAKDFGSKIGKPPSVTP
jgi:hypothetical protein